MIEAMLLPETEYQLLDGVLDGLDDLYDRRERAEWWLERLLVATSAALRGTSWEGPMAEAADGLQRVRRGEGNDDQKNGRALAATGELRLRVAERWAELAEPAEGD